MALAGMETASIVAIDPGKRSSHLQGAHRWIRVVRNLDSAAVIEALAELLIARGAPGHVRSDDGREFAAKTVRDWIRRRRIETAFNEPGNPWENGYVERLSSKLRDEFLLRKIFNSLREARVWIGATK
jgi:transposase InsO family protein